MQNLLAILDLAPQRFDNFIVGQNQEIVDKLKKLSNEIANNDSQQLIESKNRSLKDNYYLWGESGSGATHLLQAFNNQFSSEHTIYLPVDKLSDEIIEKHRYLIYLIDNISNSLDLPSQRCLFSLLRKADANEIMLILAGENPKNLSDMPKEISTRIAKMQSHKLIKLSDYQKMQAMIGYAKRKEFRLNTEIANLFLKLFPRDMRVLISLIDKFDDWSLANKTSPTLAMARKMIKTDSNIHNNL